MKRQRVRERASSLSTRLLTVLASVLASALLMVGLAIYAESQPPVFPEPEVMATETPETSEKEEEPKELVAAEEPVADLELEVIEEPKEQEALVPDTGATDVFVPVPRLSLGIDTFSETLGDPDDPDATQQPECTPTPAPPGTPAAYKLFITPPSGWFTDRANVRVRLVDENNTGWESVAARVNVDGSWFDLTHKFIESDSIEIEITDNCTLYFTVVAPNGKSSTISRFIECFDREPPSVRAGLDGEYLRVQAKDNLSGVKAITVCGHRFTELADDAIRIRLQDYADNYEEVFVQAEDHAGNLSQVIKIKNRYYNPRMPTPAPTPSPRPTAVPQATPRPTQTPTRQPSGSGGSSGGQGSTSVTSTPVSFSTPVPSGTPEPEIRLPWDDEPSVTPVPTPAQMPTIQPGTGFSIPGNAVARDLLYDKHTNKQFLRVQARGGSSYFIVIDYDKPLDEAGESYETYFLNMVDARDLLDVIDEDDLPERFRATTPAPTEIPIPTMPPTPPPVPTPEPDPVPLPAQTEGGSGGIVILLLIAGGGGAVWYFKFRKPQEKGRKKSDYDDFGMDDEYEEDEPEEEADGDDA